MKNIAGGRFYPGNDQFGDMSTVADEIKKSGMRPGLWTRPLLANVKDKPSLLIPIRQNQADLKERYLDPTIPENLQRIGTTIHLYKSWGFHLIKHDYTSYDFFGRWGFEMKDTLTEPGWLLRTEPLRTLRSFCSCIAPFGRHLLICTLLVVIHSVTCLREFSNSIGLVTIPAVWNGHVC
jgi:hypothetical protein